MGDDLAAWLAGIGLSKYADAFTAAEIDLASLPHLTEEDLRELGLPIGPRRKLLAAAATIGTAVPRIAADASNPAATEPERRQLTVLFADLVGSTQLAQAMDPELLRGVIRSFQDAAAGAIARYEGHVAKFMGDGVLAYFGWPRAHEDDAERSVRAALALIESLAGMSEPRAARVGIATGTVVVGDVIGSGGAREEAAVGETLNLAARLQQAADPGTVVVSSATRTLFSDVFETTWLGAQRLKGIDAPVDIWRIAGERTYETRFEATRGRSIGRLIGREQEIALALSRWETACNGEGQVLIFSAEPGIGKSRLVREIRGRVEPATGSVIRYQGSPHHTSSVLYPVIQQLARAAEFGSEDDELSKQTKLAALARRLRIEARLSVALLAELLSTPLSAAEPPLGLTAQESKAGTLALLVDIVGGLARASPVLIEVEDLHWFDPTSRELLDVFVDRIVDMPVLMLVTTRPEAERPWEGRGHVTVITLNRLMRRHVEAQVLELAGGSALPQAVLDHILAKSDGIPLFVEEMTKAVLESGVLTRHVDRFEITGPLPEFAVPTSLQASLLARLDRLADTRDVVQTAAAIGREFEFDLLARVSSRSERDVASALDRLHRAELIFPRGSPPRTRWSFKHALVQETAYETLLRSSRAALHARIADTIAAAFPAMAAAEPETVARHYQSAGDPSRAAALWEAAGQQALSRYAGQEAIRHLRNAIKQRLEAAPNDPALFLRVELGQAQCVAGAPLDARLSLLEAAGLARSRGDSRMLALAAIEISISEMLAGVTSREALDLLREADALFTAGDDSTKVRLLTAIGRTSAMNGDFVGAAGATDAAIALADRIGDERARLEALEVSLFVPAGPTDEQIARYRARSADILSMVQGQRVRQFMLTSSAGHIYWCAQFGEIDGIRLSIQRYNEYTRGVVSHYDASVIRHSEVMLAILEGNFATAERIAIEARELGEAGQIPNAQGIHGVQMFTIRREQGRLAEVAGLFKQMIDDEASGSAWEPGFALIASDLGFDAAARRILEKFARTGFDLPVAAVRSASLAYFSEIAVRLGERESARKLYGLMRPYREMTITIGMTVVCYGAASRYLGLLADLLDQRDASAEHFEQALAMNARMEARSWLAHTQADYAAALRRWGRPGDILRAEELTASASTTAESLGMVRLRKRLADA